MSLTPEQEQRAGALEENRTLGEAQFVVADPSSLSQSSVLIPLGEQKILSLQLDHRLDRGPDDFTWIGSPDSPAGQSVLVVHDGEITGVIYDGIEQYSITPLGAGLHALTKVDHRAFPPDHPPGPLPRAPHDPNERRGDASGDGRIEIDFLGVYTPQALSANANIVSTIQLAVDMANASYLASNANVRLRLVGTMLATGYSEAGKSYQGLLEDITFGAGAMSAVHTQRNALGADLVGLFVNNGVYCGMAWVNSSNAYAYSVTSHFCVNNHTFAHELGHNFGAWHDIANSPINVPFLYGHGYIHPQNLWRTIQSYPGPCGNCPRIGNFSNPQVNHNGHPTGTVTQHDVARVHRERAATIANFRATVIGNKGDITSPAPDSTLPGSSVNFQWNPGSGAQGYWLYVGSSAGGSQYHDSGALGSGTLSRPVTGLPTNGSTIHVRLYTRLGGAWQHNDYSYTAFNGTKAAMTSPGNGTTLAGTSVTFNWNAGTNASAYWLYVGSSVGGSQYHDSGQLSTGTLSRAVTGLPANGSAVHVRLYTQLGGVWHYNDYSYSAYAGVKAAVTSPGNGTTLAGSTVTFQWNAGADAQAYWLYVGSSVGGSQYHDSGNMATGTLSRQVAGLPIDGSPVHVRLYTLLGNGWQFNDYSYTAVTLTPAKAAITAPANGTTLTDSTVTFTWNAGTGAQAYWLYVGSSVGGSQYHDSGQLAAGTLSRQVAGLPANASTVHVRLFTRLGGAWQHNDYSYTAVTGVKAAITAPANGATLDGATVTFTWNAGAGAQAYWLYVGSSVGGLQYHNSGQLAAGTLSRQVAGLPTNGSPVHVRLFTRLGGVWQHNDYSYTALPGARAVMTSLASGAGPRVTFGWSTGSSVTEYWLSIGTTPGGSNLFNASTGTSTWRNVSGLPTAGTVHVRLWSLIGGVWQHNDYSYTGAGAGIAAMTLPAQGATLPGTTVTFNWSTGTGVSQYWLSVGTTPGGNNLFDASTGTNTSQPVTGLPTTGTVFVRLWSRQGSAWRYNDYTYTGMAGGSSLSFVPETPAQAQSAL